jgi:galactokinase
MDITQLRDRFYTMFKRAPLLFRAPGRVNLIGEHTDYNEGFVLPLALERATFVAGAVRADRVIHAHSLNLNENFSFALDRPGQRQRGLWYDYVEGMARTLAALGLPVQGADLLIASDVPVGAGLSSSAALEMAVGLALLALAESKWEPLALARAGQRAEHDYVGARVGIMDQLTSVCGRQGQALLIDCRSLAVAYLPLEDSEIKLAVCDSRVKHALAASEYNTRRSECERGVALLRQFLPGIQALRDVSVRDFQQHAAALPDIIARRCRHVITENARTLAAAEALCAGQWLTLGRLMNASHDSLRDDYEVSCAELNLLVDTARQVQGVLGARLTGGGFGGCTVNLLRAEAVERFSKAIVQEYQRATGQEPGLYFVSAGAGAAEITLNEN